MPWPTSKNQSEQTDTDGTETPVSFSAYTVPLSAYKIVKVYADNKNTVRMTSILTVHTIGLFSFPLTGR